MLAEDWRSNRIAVIGTGLIGGSILLRLRESGIDVAGWDPDPVTREDAVARHIPLAASLPAAIEGRDVVFLAGPLSALRECLAEVAKHTGESCVITDVGSTKASIAGHAHEVGVLERFVPGHPMAGTERSGMAAADPSLFDGCAWVLCPTPGQSLHPFHVVASLVINVFAARVVPMSASVHDSVVALSSHVPHLLAGALAGGVARSDLRDAVLGLAAGSFRDGTRVAGTPSARTVDMLVNNRAAVLKQLKLVQEFLSAFATDLESVDDKGLLAHFTEARSLRQRALDRPMAAQDGRFTIPGVHAELERLLAIGETGGHITALRPAGAAVAYTAFTP